MTLVLIVNKKGGKEMTSLITLLPCIAFIIIMFVIAIYINESWIEEYKKLNNKWLKYCNKLNRRIEELEKTIKKEEKK